MLEKIPAGVGAALQSVRAGIEATLYESAGAALPATIAVTSPAFVEGAAMDARFTEDGDGTSPPLAWSGVPAEARELILIVEDADAPMPRPIVHAIVHRLPGGDGALAEGMLAEEAPALATGHNTFMGAGWLPPDPPTGHGAHRYCFQLFALGAPAGLDDTPGRGAVREAIAAHGLARGRLIATYRRG